MKHPTTRRSFLKSAGLLSTAGVALPAIVPASVFGAEAPSNQITVGAIGVGGRGSDIMGEASNQANVKVLGVCDVMKSRRE